MAKKTSVEQQVKQRIASLSEARAKKLLVRLTTSYLEGAVMQNSQDIAEFVNSDLKTVFPKLDRLIEQRDLEVGLEMLGDE